MKKILIFTLFLFSVEAIEQHMAEGQREEEMFIPQLHAQEKLGH